MEYYRISRLLDAARVQTFCTPERSEVQGLWDSMMAGSAPECGGPWSVAELLSEAEIDGHLADMSKGGYVGWRLLPDIYAGKPSL